MITQFTKKSHLSKKNLFNKINTVHLLHEFSITSSFDTLER